MRDILNRVLQELTPSFSERAQLNGLTVKVVSSVNNSIKSLGLKGEVVVGGSFARGTFLSGAHDIDFFVRLSRESLVSFSKLILSVFPGAVEVRGSRSYYQVSIDGYTIEFIPALLIDNPFSADNSMDASFFHINYLNSRLTDELRGEVLLLKQFFKSCGVYGAESYIGGFSGYVTELLIIRFGGFIKFLEFIDNNPGLLFIDVEGFYDSVSKALTAMKASGLVVVVDPVLPTRNAAAGLTNASFDRFVLQARLFLRKPGPSFFRVKDKLISDLRELAEERGHAFFSHKFEVSSKPDVFLSKLASSLERVKASLEREDFMVYDFGFLLDGTVYFEFERDSLPLVKRVVGPPVSINSPNFDAFINKRAVHGPYVFDGRVCFDVLREHTRAKLLLTRLLKEIKF